MYRSTFPRRGLLLGVHYDDGVTGRMPGLGVQLGLDAFIVRQKYDFTPVVATALHQIIALFVDGTEAGLLDLQHPVGHLRHLGRVTVVGIEDTDQVRRGATALLVMEEGLDLGPGKEIGMNDLIRIAAEDEVAGSAQGFEDQLKLDIGQVLPPRRRPGSRNAAQPVQDIGD